MLFSGALGGVTAPCPPPPPVLLLWARAFDTSAFGLRGDFTPKGKYVNLKAKLILPIPKGKLETEPTPATFC